MMYCEYCDAELFGGSICHVCGGPLVPKIRDEGPKVVHVSSDLIMGPKKRISVDTAQSLPGRLFRLVLEIAIFCVLFYFVSLAIVITMNWLGSEMADAEGRIDTSGKGFRMFTYIGAVVVALLTIKFRFQSGK